MIAYGNTPNSSVIKTFDPTLVNDAGRVILKPTLQFSSADSSLDHIFAVGDITNIVETKLWYTAQVRPSSRAFALQASSSALLTLVSSVSGPCTYRVSEHRLAHSRQAAEQPEDPRPRSASHCRECRSARGSRPALLRYRCRGECVFRSKERRARR